MTNNKPEQNPNATPQETLAERSARLEAEAEALATKDASLHYESYAEMDPLAPTPHPEDNNEQHIDGDHIDGEQAKAIITALQGDMDALKDQLMRAVADAENTRRRAVKERQDAGKFAISGFAKDLLDISDTLRRAIEAAPADMAEADPRIKTFIEGVEATERVLLKAFEKHGITKIEPLDEPFNPNFHEVMFEAPVPGKPAGLVMQVMEPGYILNDRLLRAAKVGVTKDDGTGGASPSHPGGTIDTEA